MKQSIKRKSLLSIVCTVLITIVIGLCISFAFSNKFYTATKQRSLKNAFETVNKMYDQSGGSTLTDAEYDELSVFCEENTISMLIVGQSQHVEFSFGNSAAMVKRVNEIIFGNSKDNIKVIEKTDNYVLQSHIGDRNTTGYVEIWGILDNGNVIISRSSYAGINHLSKESVTFFTFVFMIIFIMTAILVFFVVKPYADSLNDLLLYAQKANQGEFSAEYEESKSHKNDEIGMLGANISEMSRKLEKTISELKTSNLKLENELKGRIEQDEARKKYMSDVSHELKTPIALISGYAEGIKEGISDSPEEREYYCNVIIDEAEKMNTMIKKLATLNQLENGRNEVILERFNLSEVIDGFLNTMAIVIEEKGANIYFDRKQPVYVWSDEFLVEEVLMNYFNNALNHMDDSKVIRINAEYHDDKTVRMTVYNSGNFIGEEEMDKIWGQFYKIDKARTREYGGSGLGLSIVKAIADSLGQECGVTNVDSGVAFWINLEGVERVREDPEVVKVRRVKKLTDLPIWKKATGKH